MKIPQFLNLWIVRFYVSYHEQDTFFLLKDPITLSHLLTPYFCKGPHIMCWTPKGCKTTPYNILLSCHKFIVSLNLLFLKQKNGSMTCNLSSDLIDDFIIFLPLTCFPTITANIPNVKEECRDSQVWHSKTLWSTNEWQILQGPESQNTLTDASRS